MVSIGRLPPRLPGFAANLGTDASLLLLMIRAQRETPDAHRLAGRHTPGTMAGSVVRPAAGAAIRVSRGGCPARAWQRTSARVRSAPAPVLELGSRRHAGGCLTRGRKDAWSNGSTEERHSRRRSMGRVERIRERRDMGRRDRSCHRAPSEHGCLQGPPDRERGHIMRRSGAVGRPGTAGRTAPALCFDVLRGGQERPGRRGQIRSRARRARTGARRARLRGARAAVDRIGSCRRLGRPGRAPAHLRPLLRLSAAIEGSRLLA